MKKYDEEKIKWLEEREQKLEEIEKMIYKFQNELNDSEPPVVYLDKISKDELWNKLSDVKMAIFKLWYFNHFGKKYDL